MSVTVTVPGQANPWLSDVPNGTSDGSGAGFDTAPQQSSVFALDVSPGAILTFEVSGGVRHNSFGPVYPIDGSPDTPDQGHAAGALHGISDTVAPLGALMGVFLSDNPPTDLSAPSGLQFTDAGIGTNFASLAPELQQVFFIGDGLTESSATQEFTVPDGATRLFLGAMDGTGWNNNIGSFEVTITQTQPVILDAFVVTSTYQGSDPNAVYLNDGNGQLSHSGQDFSDMHDGYVSVEVADLDGDGDLDAVIGGSTTRILLNNGVGEFYETCSFVDGLGAYDIGLEDLDGDGDIDMVLGERAGSSVWLNDGTGHFNDTQQILSITNGSGVIHLTSHVALGDLDGDGDLDAYIGYGTPMVWDGTSHGPDAVWLNDGNGNFTDSGQRLGLYETRAVGLGDFDGDGDLDAIIAVANSHTYTDKNRVFFNDGNGTFTESAQQLGSLDSLDVAVGDVDGDGDLDAVFSNGYSVISQPNTVWLNDGNGNFTDSGQRLGSGHTNALAMGDLDGDGDLDLYFADRYKKTDDIFWNNGAGVFTNSNQVLGAADSLDVVLGDFSGVPDVIAPIADIVDVSPDPIVDHAGLVMVTFSEHVLNLDISDFSLTRNGEAVDLSGVELTEGCLSATLDLASVTGTPGDYVLTLNPSDVTDLGHNAPAEAATDAFTVVGRSVSIQAGDSVKAEGDSGVTTFTFELTRNFTDGALSVDWQVSGAEVDAADFASGLPFGTAEFADGQDTTTVTIEVSGDSDVEDDEAFTVTLTDAGETSIAQATAEGLIQNDDSAGVDFAIHVQRAWSNGWGNHPGSTGGFSGYITIVNTTGEDQIAFDFDLDLNGFGFNNMWAQGTPVYPRFTVSEGVADLDPTGNPWWQPVIRDGEDFTIHFNARTQDHDALEAILAGTDTFEAYLNDGDISDLAFSFGV